MCCSQMTNARLLNCQFHSRRDVLFPHFLVTKIINFPVLSVFLMGCFLCFGLKNQKFLAQLSDQGRFEGGFLCAEFLLIVSSMVEWEGSLQQLKRAQKPSSGCLRSSSHDGELRLIISTLKHENILDNMLKILSFSGECRSVS